jgi:hypothetical protein
MSSEAFVVAIEAIGRERQPMATTQVAAVVQATNVASANHFEFALTKASDIAPTQGYVDPTRETAVQVGTAQGLPDQLSYEFAIHPIGDNQTLQRRLGDYLQGFSDRASSYPSDMNNAVQYSSSDGPGSIEGATGVTNTTPPLEGGMSTKDALQLMQRTFLFSIEVGLVSNVGHQGTKVVNDLMKGQ